MTRPSDYFSKKQLIAFSQSVKKWNIWEGSVRSGKTHVSIYRWIEFVATAPEGGELIMVGYTSSTLYRNIITPMKEILGDQMIFLGSRQIVKLWGRKIHCLYAKDEDSANKLRGITLAGVYGDEVTLWHVKFFIMLQSRMSAKGATAFLTTNPDSPHHWLKESVLDNPKLQKYLARFVFKLTDNEWLMRENPEYVEELISSYPKGSVHYMRFIEGLWVLAEGLIYDGFDEGKHTYDDDFQLPYVDSWYAPVDYGTQNPFSCLKIAESTTWDGKNIYYVDDEYWYCGREEGRNKSADRYADDLLGERDEYGAFKTEGFLDMDDTDKIIVDPSELAFITKLREIGANAVSADNDVQNGIRLVQILLNKGRLKIHKRCKKLIREFSLYCYDEKKVDDTPIKENDHALDALRYFCNTVIGYDNMYNIDRLVSEEEYYAE